MAKNDELTAAELVEVETLEREVLAEEAAERSTDARVAAVFAGHTGASERRCGVCDRPESEHGVGTDHGFQPAPLRSPVVLDVAKGIIPEKPAETAAACLCREIEESRALFSAGNAVSPSQLMGLLNRASAWVKEPDYR